MFIYKNRKIKLIIEEDSVGFYLVVYKDLTSTKSNEDQLFDSLDEAFEEAKNRFGISKNEWQQLSS